MQRTCAGLVSMGRAAMLAVCLLAMAASLLPAAPSVAQEPAAPEGAGQQSEEEERWEAERLEREREEREREERERKEEEERQERERRERERQVELTDTLQAAKETLADEERKLLSALANRNLASGDLVVARLDHEDARERLDTTRRRVERAERELQKATQELETASDALAVEAAAAYQAGSTTQTPSMIAMEALVSSRSPEEFSKGLAYLDAMLAGRAEQHESATRDVARWARSRRAGQRAHERAEERLEEAAEALAAAETEAPLQQRRLEAALAAHAALTDDLVRFAATQRAAAEEADVADLTPQNVALAGDLTALARSAAEDAQRLAAGSERIAAGRDGLAAWGDLQCPVDGSTQFVNDWGFPRSGGRSHEGTDVFAERGTPIVAMADAVVVEISRFDVGLGGRSVTYEIDGHRVYNAHLDTVAQGLEVGDEVEAGQPIGTVGVSGNARSTPPHNHVGFYRPDDAPVNPYPTLRRSCR